MRKLLHTLSFSLVFICSNLFAASGPLDLVLTKGVSSAIPIAIVPFGGQDNLSATDNVSQVVMADLQNSGQFKVMDSQNMTQTPHTSSEVDFKYWRQAQINNLVVGSVIPQSGNQYKINFSLFNVFPGQEQTNSNSALINLSLTVPVGQLRKAAHHISDVIYQQLTGVRGVFSTRIAYVLVQRGTGKQARYTLQVADMDGFNPRPLLSSSQPIMSPSWSHNSKQIAYVSFENITPQIFVQDVMSGSRRAVSNFPGINGAPAWSSDDSQLALVLSKGGHPKIYSINLASGQTKQLTQGASIDTEPNWSPDGQSIIFTSDRGGGPQIYQLKVNGGQTHRITYQGPYNARATFTPDGKSLVMIHREAGEMYNIAVQDLKTDTIQVLSRSGFDASPSVSPNGKMVLYESGANQRGSLGMISIDGKVQLRIPSQGGNVQDPAWSPFLS